MSDNKDKNNLPGGNNGINNYYLMDVRVLILM